MAFAKATLQQLFSWCPLNQQSSPATVDRQQDIDAAASNRPVKQHRQMGGDGQQTAMPDIRQCEPWRQSALLDAATRNDASRHERLSR
jgi:hypothetical protein